MIDKMGRQVNFYMLPEDAKEFIEFVKNTGKVEIIASKSKNQVPQILELDIHSLMNVKDKIYLWNRDIPDKIIFTYLDKRKIYYIDEDISPVIELSLCYMNKNELRWGRIWVQMKYWKKTFFGYKLIEKPKEFQKWYEQIGRWIKKKKNYIRWGDMYISKRVKEWKEKGGKLIIN
ncbi:hypothetical protein HYV49_04545 [Candidatus Pacearchaeota archaeon]|nr:hypothetical protein [Candidatus Pacearchaeota archaeon]